MLRTIRLTLAIVFFAIITLLFLDFSGTLHGYMGWMAKIHICYPKFRIRSIIQTKILSQLDFLLH